MVRPASTPCLPTLLTTSGSSNSAGSVLVGWLPPRLRRSVSLSELGVEPYTLPTQDEEEEGEGSGREMEEEMQVVVVVVEVDDQREGRMEEAGS